MDRTPKAPPAAKTRAKKNFAERLADKTSEKRCGQTLEQKAENDRKAAEGRKRKGADAACAAHFDKKSRGDIKNLPDSEKAKIKCKFWNSDPSKSRCTGNPCPFKHV